jgi:hypothetical protein
MYYQVFNSYNKKGIYNKELNITFENGKNMINIQLQKKKLRFRRHPLQSTMKD